MSWKTKKPFLVSNLLMVIYFKLYFICHQVPSCYWCLPVYFFIMRSWIQEIFATLCVWSPLVWNYMSQGTSLEGKRLGVIPTFTDTVGKMKGREEKEKRKWERKTMEWGKNREIRKEKKERRNKERRGGRKKGEEERWEKMCPCVQRGGSTQEIMLDFESIWVGHQNMLCMLCEF